MGTAPATQVGARGGAIHDRRDLRFEHLFFSGMAVLILVSVFVGFARTYFLAGVFWAPLPNRLIQAHGAAFSCWILLLCMQTSLVSAGRVDIHRKLGIGAFCLACAMVVLGILAATDSLSRNHGIPGMEAHTFYAVPLGDMLVFSTLIFFAFRARRRPATHKRLILVATIALMNAAFVRWPLSIVHLNLAMACLFGYVLVVFLAAYDLWSVRRIHSATLWAGLFLIAVQQLRIPVGRTVAWHGFAEWALHLYRMST